MSFVEIFAKVELAVTSLANEAVAIGSWPCDAGK